MTTLSARFRQSPAEKKRYVMDYTLQLATGESILTLTPTVTQTGGTPNPNTAFPFVVNGVALLPPVSGQVIGGVFYASGGFDSGRYEITFIATTSIGQILEDVVQFNLQEKT